VRVAINQRFASADTPLANGDELAFLPPISGG
jgi:molybdopterin converting factor small subunit